MTSATQKKLTVASCCTCSSSGLDAHTPTETCSLFLLPPPLLTSSHSNSSVGGPIRPLPVVSPGQCSDLPFIPRRGLQHQWGRESQGEGTGVCQWMLHEPDGGWGKVHCGRASYLTELTWEVTVLLGFTEHCFRSYCHCGYSPDWFRLPARTYSWPHSQAACRQLQ